MIARRYRFGAVIAFCGTLFWACSAAGIPVSERSVGKSSGQTASSSESAIARQQSILDVGNRTLAAIGSDPGLAANDDPLTSAVAGLAALSLPDRPRFTDLPQARAWVESSYWWQALPESRQETRDLVSRRNAARADAALAAHAVALLGRDAAAKSPVDSTNLSARVDAASHLRSDWHANSAALISLYRRMSLMEASLQARLELMSLQWITRDSQILHPRGGEPSSRALIEVAPSQTSGLRPSTAPPVASQAP